MQNLNTEDNIENLYERLDKQYELIKSNQEHVKIILREVIGENKYGNKAYKHRISDNEEGIAMLESEIDRQEQRFNNIYNKIVGICIGVSLAASALGFFIKNSIMKVKATPIQKVQQLDSYPINNPTYPDLTEDLSKAVIREKDSLKTER